MTLDLQYNLLFKNFCSLGVNRYEFIIKLLGSNSIPYNTLELDGAKHIIVFPKNLKTKATCLIAHYDRVPNTPGANDNSASIFFLIKHFIDLLQKDHNSVGIFTDREEIGGETSVTQQGSYSLGKYLKKNNLVLEIYIFDMCGIGTTLLLGTGGETLLKQNKNKYKKMLNEVSQLKENAEKTLLSVNYGEFFYLTPLFSDDLGLILNGYPSILISLLPYREAVNYQKDSGKIPKSWRCNHTIKDSIETLDPLSGNIILHLLGKISRTSVNEKKSLLTNNRFRCYTQSIESKERLKGSFSVSYYIIEDRIDFSRIKTNNQGRIDIIRLLVARTKTDFSDYLYNLILDKTGDFHYDIFTYIRSFVADNFILFPIGLRNSLLRLYNCTNLDLFKHIFTNVLNNLGDTINISSIPNPNKVDIYFNFKPLDWPMYELELKTESDYIGQIKIAVESNEVILLQGCFKPKETLKLDPLNLLKALRTILIKWAKSNNNTSLRIIQKEEDWLGCHQLISLLRMELNGRSDYIWKEYNV